GLRTRTQHKNIESAEILRYTRRGGPEHAIVLDSQALAVDLQSRKFRSASHNEQLHARLQMPDAGKRFLQQIESLFRAQHADRSNKKRSIRDRSGLRRRRWVELGGVDAVIADFDSLIPDLFVDHVAAHGLAVDHYSIHHAVRPPHLAASTLVEQISAA